MLEENPNWRIILINPALIVHVESNSNKGSGGEGQYEENRPLEQEAIRCFKSWRNLGGTYKDIPIYAICHTNNPPSDETIDEFKKLDVKFIHEYLEITDTFPAGWWSIPLMGVWAEHNLKEHDFFIHIDLDMILIRELTTDILEVQEGRLAKCAVYSKDYPDEMRIDPQYDKLFVTCFVTSYRESFFYDKWWCKMIDLKYEWTESDIDLNDKDNWWKYCNLEEHAVDVLYREGADIQQVHKIQFGQDQGYETIDDLTDKQLRDNVYFFHNHSDNDGTKVIIEYMKRMKNVKTNTNRK